MPKKWDITSAWSSFLKTSNACIHLRNLSLVTRKHNVKNTLQKVLTNVISKVKIIKERLKTSHGLNETEEDT